MNLKKERNVKDSPLFMCVCKKDETKRRDRLNETVWLETMREGECLLLNKAKNEKVASARDSPSALNRTANA